jgi:hypothetical protein
MALSKEKTIEVEDFILFNMTDEFGGMILSSDLFTDLVIKTRIGLDDAVQIVKLIEYKVRNEIYN